MNLDYLEESNFWIHHKQTSDEIMHFREAGFIKNVDLTDQI
jgi:hypothetical protein